MNKFTDLYYELEGVVIDVEQGDGLDDVCLETIKRVQKKLAALAKGCAPALADEEILKIGNEGCVPDKGKLLTFTPTEFIECARALLSRQIAEQNLVAAEDKPSRQDVRATESAGWINVKDRLPELIEDLHISTNVLVWVHNSDKVCSPSASGWVQEVCINWRGVWTTRGDDLVEYAPNLTVTHWMPLPPAPAAAKEKQP